MAVAETTATIFAPATTKLEATRSASDSKKAATRAPKMGARAEEKREVCFEVAATRPIAFFYGVAAGEAIGEAAGIGSGVATGVGAGVGMAAGVGVGVTTLSQGVEGRNSRWRMRPPASAVQMLREIEMAFPKSTAEVSQRAAFGNLTKARRAKSARIAHA